MASTDRPTARVEFERLRAPLERLWRPIAGQPRAVRWGLAAAVVLTLAAVSYWGSANFSASGVRYLASGKRFSSDALIKVGRALEKEQIAYRIDDARRVEVASEKFEQAAEIVAKLELGPLPFGVIREDESSPGIFDGEKEREYHEKVRLERMLERLIGEQEGVVSTVVSINRPRARPFSRPTPKPTALVYVETEKGRAVPSRSVQAILSLLDSMVPDLETESITVMDHRGMRYLDPGNPALRDHTRNRAREEEITEEILEKLDWIKGLRVQVRVPASSNSADRGSVTTGAARGSATAAGRDAAQQTVVPAHAGATGDPALVSGSSMAANHPLSLEPGGEEQTSASEVGSARVARAISEARTPAEPVPHKDGTLTESGPHNPASPAANAAKDRGRVVVYVPRSFYLNMEIRGDQGKPSLEELRVMADRTEKSIRTAISLLLPEPDSWDVDVTTFADDFPHSRPTVLSDGSGSRLRLMEWLIVGAVGAGAFILAIAGSWFHMARKPARLPEPSAGTRRYHAGSDLLPSPSERVRELIQRNPEAAASVLQRWVGQGGRSS